MLRVFLVVVRQADHFVVVLDRLRIVAEAAVVDLCFTELRFDIHRIDFQDLVEKDHGRIEAVLFHGDLVAKSIERDQLVVFRIDPRAGKIREERGEKPVARDRRRAFHLQSLLPHFTHPPMALASKSYSS